MSVGQVGGDSAPASDRKRARDLAIAAITEVIDRAFDVDPQPSGDFGFVLNFKKGNPTFGREVFDRRLNFAKS